ncbi:hypothetical protein DFJ63DRAFT_314497 [Scheffersomyces coipomensis]|uniref:uncharacterized protein n=1 Tax=Scheffersomyces coipomensis TaxID=1788519 RepID=UPI00315DA8D3
MCLFNKGCLSTLTTPKQNQSFMIYETNIIPGEGLGNHIKLGESMYTIMKYLDKFQYKLRVSYSDTNFLNVPILITVLDLGIRLTFVNQKDQVLDLIEVMEFDSKLKNQNHTSNKLLKLMYNGISLNEIESSSGSNSNNNSNIDIHGSLGTVPLDLTGSASKSSSSSTILETSSAASLSSNSTFHTLVSTGPTLKSIYNKIFGPTYPGIFNKETQTYILSYPGISFKFKIRNETLLNKIEAANDDQILSILLNWDGNLDLVCSTIALHKGKSWSQFKLSNNSSAGTGVDQLHPRQINSKPAVSGLKFYLDTGKILVSMKNKEGDGKGVTIEIILGKTTQQEVVNILGPPDDYFNKFDSRLLIHKHLSLNQDDVTYNSVSDKLDSDSDLSHFKFHNYFKYGIDILYDLNNNKSNKGNTGMSATVKKVIAHNGGLTESLNFMKWNRCFWEVYTTIDGEEIKFDSSMYFKDLPPRFRNLTPVLLNRNESEFIDNEFDIIELPNATEEVKEEEDTKFSGKVKTWGQSKLYGFERCIVEAINSNGCISSVTVY